MSGRSIIKAINTEIYRWFFTDMENGYNKVYIDMDK